MYVCMCVCVFVCVYVCIYIYVKTLNLTKSKGKNNTNISTSGPGDRGLLLTDPGRNRGDEPGLCQLHPGLISRLQKTIKLGKK